MDYFDHRIFTDEVNKYSKKDIELADPEKHRQWQKENKKPNVFFEQENSQPKSFRLTTKVNQHD